MEFHEREARGDAVKKGSKKLGEEARARFALRRRVPRMER